MKITKNKLILKVPSDKYLPSIINDIRENLERMGVNGLTIDARYDVRSNIALLRFNFKEKNFEMKVGNQGDVRANMWAINKRVEYKARMHLLGIEDFDVSMSPYLAIEDRSGTQQNYESYTASSKAYAAIGLPEYASNYDVEKRYKELAKSFHPDMALSSEAKIEFEKRMAEINEAYGEIKKERGM